MAGLMAGLLMPALARAQSQALTPPQSLLGPTSDLLSLSGMSIARDGTGGLVFLEKVDGVPHVFVSRLLGGSYQPPVQVDAGLSGASSQPVIAAGDAGVLIVAFINGGELYISQTTSPAGTFPAPDALYPGAQSPAISISAFGKAYLAFVVSAGDGENVDVAYYDGASWAFATGPMNVTPGDTAGTGLGRPAVVTAGDGEAIVAWGESGHVYSRRVWATAPSVEYEQLDPATFEGETEVSADSPEVSAGADSSYPDIVFDEHFTNGSSTVTRVLLARLIAEDTVPAVAIDGLSASSTEGAGQAAIALTDSMNGFATATTTTTNELQVTRLAGDSAPSGGPIQPDPQANLGLPYAVPGTAGATATMVAWQQTSVPATGQIELAYAEDGYDLSPPVTVSDPAGGPTQAQDGLLDAGDIEGDAAVSWIQGSGGDLSLDTAQLYVSPGETTPLPRYEYTRDVQPVVSWPAARESWGPLEYQVTLDGRSIGETTATSITVPTPLNDGPHVFQITTTNAAGLQATGATSTIFVDTVAPRLRVAFTGRPRIGDAVTLHLTAVDPAAAEAYAIASGLATIELSWGDGSKAIKASKLATARHVYARPGLYRITLTVTDKAGNVTTFARYLRILPPR